MRPPFSHRAVVLAMLAVGVCGNSAWAQVSSPERTPEWTEPPLVRASQLSGRLEGTVTDDKGAPLPGVAVAAHGTHLQFAVTDRQGRFVFESLPPGSYFVRAHLPGFAASRRELVEVASARASVRVIRLSRAAEAAVSAARPLLAASMAGLPPQGEEPVADEAEESDHDHSAVAWRVRHVPRSVLRDAGNAVLPAEPEMTTEAADTAGQALSFLSDLPFSGQVQLLTTSSFDSAEELFTGGRMPRGVAYIAITAPEGSRTDWAVQGAMSDGDVSSWILGGSYASTIAREHGLDVGVTYAAQRYDGANPVLLLALGEASRTVGSLHVFDSWAVVPNMTVTAGGRYSRYGYLEQPGLLSPSVEWRWGVGSQTAIRALVVQQMLAPGAEEFVPSPMAAVWMPPQRTFSSLQPDQSFRAERSRHVEVGFEHRFASVVLEAHGFRQSVDDQVVTLFGLKLADRPRTNLGHYYTATAGDVDATGWGVGVSRPMASRLRGSVRYTQTQATWLSAPDVTWVGAVRPATRPVDERIHDLTTAVETDIPETATRVYAAYKLNTGFASADDLDTASGIDGRFDVQVSQRLPFVPLGDSEWEVLVAVRNLFRDPVSGASVFDELLVVRPPKRIVGGLLVRF